MTNKVGFRLLGLIAGYVGLRGRFEAVGDAADTVKVWHCTRCFQNEAAKQSAACSARMSYVLETLSITGSHGYHMQEPPVLHAGVL